MEVITGLLRIAARIAGASVALVAREHTEAPLAAWGADAPAAEAILRAVRRAMPMGAWSFRSLPLALSDGGEVELILVAPANDPDEAALTAIAAEIAAAYQPAAVITPAWSALERLTESIDQLGDAMAIVATAIGREREPTHVLHVNTSFTQLFGYAAHEIVGKSTALLWGARTDDARMRWLRSRVAQRDGGRTVVVLYAKDGTPMWVEVGATPIPHDADVVHSVITLRDVSARKHSEDALAAEKRKLQTTLASIADAVVTVLADGRIEFINAAARQLLGVEWIDAYGEHVRDAVRLVDADGAPVDVLTAGTADVRGVRRGTGYLTAKGGGTTDIAFVVSSVDDDRHGIVIVLRDVTAERRLAVRLTFEAMHDALTGLQNRRAFTERLDDAVRAAQERDEHHVVGYLDLDRFKVVNDRFGHAAGDRLLREIALVMAAAVREGDVIARIGGDEFGLLLLNCRLDDARWVAGKIRAAVDGHRIEHDGEQLGVGVSIGLAPIGAETLGGADALAAADAACYEAKVAGRRPIAG